MIRNRQRLEKLIYGLSERFNLDLGYFLKGGTWLAIPVFINYALGILRSVFFARLTPPTVYGQFGFINSIYSTFDLLSLPGINPALAETSARGNYGSIFLASKTRARWGMLGTLGMAGVAVFYYVQSKGNLSFAILAAGAFLPCIAAFQVVQAYYNGIKRFDLSSWIMILYAFLNTALLLIIIWLKKDIIWLIVINYGTQLLVYFLFFKSASSRVRQSPQDPEVVAYGRSLTWAGAITAFSFELDSVILGLSAGFIEVAIYRIASIIPESIKNLLKILTPLVVPKIAEKPEKRVYTPKTRMRIFILMAVNLVIVLVAILLIPFVIHLLYGEEYQASIFFAQLLMISLLGGLPGYFFAGALQARKQVRSIYNYNLIYAILQISSLVLLVPWLGTLGIVISRIITRFGSTLYQWYAVTKI